jgi:O-antigen/teichoic acid export membrane protein
MAVAIPLYTLITQQPEIVLPAYLLAAAVPALALQAPTWVFYRRLNFVRQRSLEAIEPIVSFAITIPLAIAGLGYWSLVLGVFIGRWVGGFAAVKAAPYRLRLRIDRSTASEYFRFSWPVVASSTLGLMIPQLSILVGEWKLGLAGAGVIALAGSIMVYTDRVNAIVTQALYPTICAVRDRTDLLYEGFVKSNRLALMWGLPFGIGITLFASDLVTFALGERWLAAVALMQIWGSVAAANHIGFNWHAFYRAKGITRPLAVLSVVSVAALATSILPLVEWKGLVGFGLAVGVMVSANLVGRGYYLAKLFPGFRLANHALRAIAPVVPAIAAVLALRALIDTERSLLLASGELALYIAMTAGATVLLERALLREAVGYLRVRTRSPTPAPA